MNKHWPKDWDEDDLIDVTVHGESTQMRRIDVEEEKRESIARSTKRVMDRQAVWLRKEYDMAAKKTTQGAGSTPAKTAATAKTDAEKLKAAKAKEREQAAKEKARTQAAKAKEKEKAAKAKEKEKAAKEKARTQAAKAKEREKAAKAKEREKAAKAKETARKQAVKGEPRYIGLGDDKVKLTAMQGICYDYIVANPGCAKLAPAGLVSGPEDRYATGYACINALIKKGLVEAKQVQENGRTRYALNAVKIGGKKK